MWINDNLYQSILANIPIVCVDVAIIKSNQVLLVRRNREPAKGEWWLPGGRLYKNESLSACAVRKAQEETGIYCLPGPLVHTQGTIFDNVHSVNFCYVMFPKDSTKVMLDETSSDFKWYYLDRGLMDLNGYVGNCLRKVVSDLH